jgi:heme exporter protein C
MFIWFHKLASPPYFYRLAGRLAPWFGWLSLVVILAGLYGGLWLAPPDYQQGDGFRIMYVHVPSAWMSLFVYGVMAVAAAVGLIWRMKLAHAVSAAAAPLGASFTFLALVTGSLWGKPMWGTYWVWDARLTSMLLLFFLYLGHIALTHAFDDSERGDRAAAILALAGVINLPIIKFSVDWWNTLHQPASVTKLTGPAIHPTILMPLLWMALAFALLFILLVLVRTETEIDRRRLEIADQDA